LIACPAGELNFTRAAERCRVAQPSITRAIKILEDELGGPLFHRERANTHLTEFGRMMKPYLERIYLEAQDAKRRAQDFVQLKKTSRRLGLMSTIAPDWLFGIIETVLKRHPGISLQIENATPSALEEALLNGGYEIAVYAVPVTSRDERLRYLALYKEEFMVVLPKDHPLSSRNIVQLSELGGERPATLSQSSCFSN
jgi:DNA-binding transcriptional LysR family regulator